MFKPTTNSLSLLHTPTPLKYSQPKPSMSQGQKNYDVTSQGTNSQGPPSPLRFAFDATAHTLPQGTNTIRGTTELLLPTRTRATVRVLPVQVTKLGTCPLIPFPEDSNQEGSYAYSNPNGWSCTCALSPGSRGLETRRRVCRPSRGVLGELLNLCGV